MGLDRPKTIAQFAHRYPPALGGAEIYCRRLCDFHASHGDRIEVFTTTAVELSEFWRRSPARVFHDDPESNPRVRRFRPATFPLRRYILKALSLVPVRPWQAAIQPSNPLCPGMATAAATYDGPLDAVHALAFPYSFPILCGLRLARRRGVPFFLTPFLHLGDPTDSRDRTRRQYTRPHLKWLLNQADGVFVQTPTEFRTVVGLGVPENRLILQGLGVDEAECTGGDRDAARHGWGLAPAEFAVGHLANASAEKGTVDLLKAAVEQNLRVVLAGPAMPSFERFWTGFARKGLVIRLGPLSDSQKRDFYVGIDAFALPSRTDSFGLVLLEAWANAKAVVAYRAGGPADLIRDGIDGWLVRCGDVAGLGERLKLLAGNATLRRSFGEAGARRVPVEFAWGPKLALVRNALLGLSV